MPPMMSGAPAPEEKKYSPEEKAKIQEIRTFSDVNLIKQGATFVPSESGEPRLEVTNQQIQNAKFEMEQDEREKEEKGREITNEQFNLEVEEIARKDFSMHYAKKILENNKSPEAYIWNGRRILRSTLQTIVRELKKTGFVKEKAGGFKSNYAPAIAELETDNKDYVEFVTALNKVMEQYEGLFTGSENIAARGIPNFKRES